MTFWNSLFVKLKEKKLGNLPKTLWHLNLSKCRFHPKYLLGLATLPITHLNLSESNVDISNYETLENLDLSGSENIHSCFPLVLPNFKNLTFLNLIANADIQKVIEMKENKNMELKIFFWIRVFVLNFHFE